MHDQIRIHFAAIEAEISKSVVLEPRRQTISEWIAKLAPLYKQYRETNASRFGDDITRIVGAICRELSTCPEAKKLEEEFREGLHRLHEDLGIPKLALKAPPRTPVKASAKKTRNVGTS